MSNGERVNEQERMHREKKRKKKRTRRKEKIVGEGIPWHSALIWTRRNKREANARMDTIKHKQSEDINKAKT